MAKNGQTAEIASFLIERLSAMRVKNNFSQRELSLRIGKESSYINRMEQSKFIPSVDTLYAIVEACNASMEELFYYDMEQYPADAELLKLFRCFSKEKKEALIKKLTAEMKAAAKLLEFEHAAYLRDKINKIREM